MSYYEQSDPDPYAILKAYKTAVLIDDTKSMMSDDSAGWVQVEETLKAMISEHADCFPSGIDVHFLNQLHPLDKGKDIKKVSDMHKALDDHDKPRKMRNIGGQVEAILDRYLMDDNSFWGVQQEEPVNLVVLMASEPHDLKDGLSFALQEFGIAFDEYYASATKYGVLFVQVGFNKEPSEYFRKLAFEPSGAMSLSTDFIISNYYDNEGRAKKFGKELLMKALVDSVKGREVQG